MGHTQFPRALLSGQPSRSRRWHPGCHRCLLKGCEVWFLPRRPQARYCSPACQEAARSWRCWHSCQRFKATDHGKKLRRDQARRYRIRLRQQSSLTQTPPPDDDIELTSPVIEPLTSPVIEPLTSPVIEPLTSPVIEPLTSPVIEPLTSPVIEPLTSPVIEPLTSPVIEPLTSPVIEPLTSPVIEPLTSPVIEPLTSPVIEPLTSPVIEPLTSPGSEPLPIVTTTGEGQRPARISEDSCGLPCHRPGCYVLFLLSARSPDQKFCSDSCRQALRRVRQRELRLRQRRRRGVLPRYVHHHGPPQHPHLTSSCIENVTL